MNKALLKVSEAAEYLGIGRSLVYELVAQQQIPFIRLGRCIRVPVKALNEWLESQERGSLSTNDAR